MLDLLDLAARAETTAPVVVAGMVVRQTVAMVAMETAATAAPSQPMEVVVAAVRPPSRLRASCVSVRGPVVVAAAEFGVLPAAMEAHKAAMVEQEVDSSEPEAAAELAAIKRQAPVVMVEHPHSMVVVAVAAAPTEVPVETAQQQTGPVVAGVVQAGRS